MHVLLLLSQACPLLICASFLHVRTKLMAGVQTPNTSKISGKAITSERMDPGKEVKVEGDKMVIHRSGVKNDEGDPDKLRILSIDGGGVRGVIPAVILNYLEAQLRENEEDKQKVIRLADYFDLIVGTSTGGLITAMITTYKPAGDDPETELPLSTGRLLTFYERNAANIFPPARIPFLTTIKQIFGTKYNPQNLNALLNSYCSVRTLSAALTNVIIPSFDIKLQQPVFFSSWETRFRDVLVKDVCRATTAAPTFLPPVYFEPQTRARNNIPQFNMIDGGIAANNPTYVGITKAIQHLSGDNPIGDPADKNYFKKLLVLSLGTGRHRTGYSAQVAKKWGVKQWLRHKGDTPLISSLQNASADMVDYNLSIIFGAHGCPENYVRIQTDISRDSPEVWKLDNAKERNLTTLVRLGETLLGQYATTVNFETGMLDPSTVLNSAALHSFATRLSKLRKKYGPHKDRSAESSGTGGERGNETPASS